MEAGDWGLADVQAVVAQVLATDAAVLSAGEGVVVRRVLALEGPSGRLWARLLGRRPDVFRVSQLHYPDVPDLEGALTSLKALDLIHGAVPESLQLGCYTVAELRGACRREGLSAAGRRRDLETRLGAVQGWSREPVIRVCCGALLRRLEALCFQDAWRDRSVWLLERLGVERWVDYPTTWRAPAFERRRDFLRWAAPVAQEATPEALLCELASLTPRPRWQRRLCRRRRVERHLVERTRELERSGESRRAAGIYRSLLQAGASDPGRVVHRLAMAWEEAGEPTAGLEAAHAWREAADPVQRIALDRVGRRLARRGRGQWSPEVPLRKPPLRQLRLVRSDADGARPLWGVPGRVVEDAVAASVPRTVLRAENALWTTLLGLLLQDLLWLPVPGMLPRSHLAGPLDLGTPDFARHRREVLEERLEALAEGGGLGLLRTAWALHGSRIRGIHWESWSLGALEAVVAGIGGRTLSVVLRRLAEEGWGAAAGLPDLVILPGPPCQLEHAFPRRLGPDLLLVEVKSPHDAVRDAQAVWFDRLLQAGASVELWRVAPLQER